MHLVCLLHLLLLPSPNNPGRFLPSSASSVGAASSSMLSSLNGMSPLAISPTHKQEKSPVLLGQFQIAAFSNNIPLLWDDHDDELPLLSSTRNLLHTLRHPLPTREGVPFASKTASMQNDVVSNSIDALSEIATEDGDDIGICEAEESKNNEAQVDEKVEDDVEFKQYDRILDIAQTIRNALEDIHYMRDRRQEKDATQTTKEGSNKVRGRAKRETRRSDALEKQRELLQKQKEGSVQDDEGDVIENEDDDGDDQDPGPEEAGPANPVLKLKQSINSLSVITPCLLRMLLHPRRHDKQLRIGGKSLKSKNRSSKCWLIFDGVYDIATNKQVEAIATKIRQLYLFHGMAAESWEKKDSRLSVCEEVIRRSVSNIQQHNSHDGTLPNWSGVLPFSSLGNVDQRSSQLDQCLGLEKSEEEIKKRSNYERCIKDLSQLLNDMLQKRFRGARLSVYGSCLSDLSLGKESDVDISLYIPEMASERRRFEEGTLTVKDYQAGVKKRVYQTCRLLENRSAFFRGMNPIARARVPVVSGTYTQARNPYSEDGSIDFDICFLNDIAVANSELLRQYSLVDLRVKQLMVTVKKWAKANKISSSKDSCLSSYTWMNLTIFYLQCLGFVPNLQCGDLQKKLQLRRDKSNEWHCVQSLNTFFLTWDQARSSWQMPENLADLSVSSLLYGFFRFYTQDFPASLYVISVKRGAECRTLKSTTTSKSNFLFMIEDPFETFDSHKPHDLGMHAQDAGAVRILDALREAEKSMHTVLTHEEAEVTLDFLWPSTEKRVETSKTSFQGNNGQKTGRKKNNSNQKQNNNQKQNKPNASKGGNTRQPSKPPNAAPSSTSQGGVDKPSQKNSNRNSNRNGRQNNKAVTTVDKEKGRDDSLAQGSTGGSTAPESNQSNPRRRQRRKPKGKQQVQQVNVPQAA